MISNTLKNLSIWGNPQKRKIQKAYDTRYREIQSLLLHDRGEKKINARNLKDIVPSV